VEAAVVPTAVFSTHTAFKNYTFRDLTDDIEGIADCFEKEKFLFDGIYTGFLGSRRQIEIILKVFDRFKTADNFILVDPAMADDGKLYPIFDSDFVIGMRSLCAKADIIVPNLTEASLLLDIPYREDYDENSVKTLLRSLCSLGCKTAILTGIGFDGKQVGAYGYDSRTDRYFSSFNKLLPTKYHGTGDVFASAFCGVYAESESLDAALKTAVDFTLKSMEYTVDDPDGVWYGVEFEKALDILTRKT